MHMYVYILFLIIQLLKALLCTKMTVKNSRMIEMYIFTNTINKLCEQEI